MKFSQVIVFTTLQTVFKSSCISSSHNWESFMTAAPLHARAGGKNNKSCTEPVDQTTQSAWALDLKITKYLIFSLV